MLTTARSVYSRHPSLIPSVIRITLLRTQDVAFRVRSRSAAIVREFLEMVQYRKRLFTERSVIELLCYHRQKGAQPRYTVKFNAV
jgi:hypothetical protein